MIFHGRLAIALVLIAALLATALNHLVEWIERWGIPRAVAISLAMLLALLGLAGVLLLVVPAAVDQVRVLIDRAPELLARIQSSPVAIWVDERLHLTTRLRSFEGEPRWLGQVGGPALRAAGGLLEALVGIITIAFLALYMVATGDALIRGLLAEALPDRRARYERILRQLYHSIGGYLIGLLVIAASNAAAMSVFLSVLGLPFFLPLAILSGLGSLVPFIGVTVSGVLITLLVLSSEGSWAAVITVGYLLAYQQFENHVIIPLVYRRTIRVNALAVLLALVLFADLFGFIGAVLAVPGVAAAQILLGELLLRRRERLRLHETPESTPPRS